MRARADYNLILNDDRLTRGLDDAEARLLIEWLIERVDAQAEDIEICCKRARAIARFVVLWCHEKSPQGALQLAATERFRWPLPTEPMDACDLMQAILAWER